MVGRDQLTATSITLVASVFGGVSLLAFVVFLFAGPIGPLRMGLSDQGVLVWDGVLSTLFFFQHSTMVRRGFRRWLSARIPSHYLDAVYALVSGATLIAAVILWQPTSAVLHELHGWARWISRAVFILAIAGIAWGVFSFKTFDPFGRASIKAHLNRQTLPPPRFTVRGPYLWVRHPLYFFVLVLMWSCPDVSLDRLFFNLSWTAWIVLGTVLEERDLVSDFGERYREYQKRAPMLIPWKRPLDKEAL